MQNGLRVVVVERSRTFDCDGELRELTRGEEPAGLSRGRGRTGLGRIAAGVSLALGQGGGRPLHRGASARGPDQCARDDGRALGGEPSVPRRLARDRLHGDAAAVERCRASRRPREIRPRTVRLEQDHEGHPGPARSRADVRQAPSMGDRHDSVGPAAGHHHAQGRAALSLDRPSARVQQHRDRRRRGCGARDRGGRRRAIGLGRTSRSRARGPISARDTGDEEYRILSVLNGGSTSTVEVLHPLPGARDSGPARAGRAASIHGGRAARRSLATTLRHSQGIAYGVNWRLSNVFADGGFFAIECASSQRARRQHAGGDLRAPRCSGERSDLGRSARCGEGGVPGAADPARQRQHGRAPRAGSRRSTFASETINTAIEQVRGLTEAQLARGGQAPLAQRPRARDHARQLLLLRDRGSRGSARSAT